jgi:phosphatidylserine synthase 2
MCFITIFLFLIELGTFYLKFILWIPPPHFLCLSRLLFFLLAGGVSMREMFEYLDNPRCKRFGRQSWVITAIVITEVLIVFKFDWETVTKPLPFSIVLVWTSIGTALVLWTLYQFWFKRFILWGQKKNVHITEKNE